MPRAASSALLAEEKGSDARHDPAPMRASCSWHGLLASWSASTWACRGSTWDQIPLSEPFADTTGIELADRARSTSRVLHTPSVVNVGNPHAIFWVDDLDAHDLGRFGPLLENHPHVSRTRQYHASPRCSPPTEITVKVWERGAGLTLACGTAACATARRRGAQGPDRAARSPSNLPGGPLDDRMARKR